jgi:hypothetical protein
MDNEVRLEGKPKAKGARSTILTPKLTSEPAIMSLWAVKQHTSCGCLGDYLVAFEPLQSIAAP